MQDRTYALSTNAGAVQCGLRGDTTLFDYVQRAGREMYAHKRRCLH